MTSKRFRITLLSVITVVWLGLEAMLIYFLNTPKSRYESPIEILAMLGATWIWFDFCLAALRHWAKLPTHVPTVN